MNLIRRTTSALLAALLLLPMHARADTDKATTEALDTYFDFVDYNSGSITAEQIPADDWKRLHVVDVRDAGQFTKEPEAVTWRFALGSSCHNGDSPMRQI